MLCTISFGEEDEFLEVDLNEDEDAYADLDAQGDGMHSSLCVSVGPLLSDICFCFLKSTKATPQLRWFYSKGLMARTELTCVRILHHTLAY